VKVNLMRIYHSHFLGTARHSENFCQSLTILSISFKMMESLCICYIELLNILKILFYLCRFVSALIASDKLKGLDFISSSHSSLPLVLLLSSFLRLSVFHLSTSYGMQYTLNSKRLDDIQKIIQID